MADCGGGGLFNIGFNFNMEVLMKKECDHRFPSDYGGRAKDCKFCGISYLEFCYKQRKEGEND